MIHVEPAKRWQNNTGADSLITSEVELQPKLLDAHFSAAVSFNFLCKLHASGFACGLFLNSNFQQAFKLGFAVHTKSVAQLGIRR